MRNLETIQKGSIQEQRRQFSGFLTTPSPKSAIFSTIRHQFWPIFDPYPLPVADVVYGGL